MANGFQYFEAFGADGYIYTTSIKTMAKDGSSTSSGVFLHIDHSKSPYQYSLVVAPPTLPSFLRQENAQGARGID